MKLVNHETKATLQDENFLANCEYVSDARSLTIEEVFVTFIRGLYNAAQAPKDSLIDLTFSAQVPGIDAAVLFRRRDGEAIEPENIYQWR